MMMTIVIVVKGFEVITSIHLHAEVYFIQQMMMMMMMMMMICTVHPGSPSVTPSSISVCLPI